jgi:hypothetical protein
MKLVEFGPLLALPVSTFVNLQSMTVPMVNRMDMIDAYRQQERSVLVMVFSSISLFFGLIANGALFVRMLEKKIKATTKLIMFGSYLQGVLAFLSLILFHALEKKHEDQYTEAMVYKCIAGILSLIAGSFTLYNYLEHIKHQQVYAWMSYSLSNDQRQFILLTISSMTYMSFMSGFYGYLEDWDFDQALYWSISTFLTIGFGDVTPKTDIGMILFPPLATVGIFLVGSNIYAMRNIFLEVLALQLASQYSKLIIIHEDEFEDRQVERALAINPNHLAPPLSPNSQLATIMTSNPIKIQSPRFNGKFTSSPTDLDMDGPSHNQGQGTEHALGVSLDSSEVLNASNSRLNELWPQSAGVERTHHAIPQTRPKSRHASLLGIKSRSSDERRMTITRSTKYGFTRRLTKIDFLV